MTDIELLDKYCEECLRFISPRLFNEVRNRGLYWVIANLRTNQPSEAKAQVRASLAARGKYIGDPEIMEIADKVDRLKFLQKKISEANVADPSTTLPLLSEMTIITEELRDYYK